MIFQFENYKEYLKVWIETQPNRGRGLIAEFGKFLNISPSLVSAILNSDRHFSVEQACELCEYLKLDKIESEYFIALVSYDKSGSEKLRKFWSEQKKQILKKTNQVKSRIKFDKILSEEQIVQYYSHAFYSQIRVLGTLEGGISLEQIAALVPLPKYRFNEVIDFLLETELIQITDGIVKSTDKVIHVNKESIHYLKHHANWRLQQLQQVTSAQESDITYTFPCTLNQEDFKKIKSLLTDVITKSHQIIRHSPAEEFACLTIDFISYYSKK